MTVVDRVAERALALAASGACDEDAVRELHALAQESQVVLEVARSLVWLGDRVDPVGRRRADELLTQTATRMVERPPAPRRLPGRDRASAGRVVLPQARRA